MFSGGTGDDYRPVSWVGLEADLTVTEDTAWRSPPTPLLDARAGYRFANGLRIQLDMFNLTDSRSDQIT